MKKSRQRNLKKSLIKLEAQIAQINKSMTQFKSDGIIAVQLKKNRETLHNKIDDVKFEMERNK